MPKKVLLVLVYISFLTVLSGDVLANGTSNPTLLPGTLHPELQISDDTTLNADHYHPALAYNTNHHEFLVVWHTSQNGSRDIRAQRVSKKGKLTGFAFSITNDSVSSQPSIAYNPFYDGDEYLVVWMKDVSGNGTQYEIWGRIIPWDGPGNSPSFRIYGWTNRTFWSPKVAFNRVKKEYFVIWTAMDTATGNPTDIAGVHVSASGVPDAQAHFVVSEGDPIYNNYRMSMPHQANLAINNYLGYPEYFVVWRGKYQGTTTWQIYGTQMYWYGDRKGGLFCVGGGEGPYLDNQSPSVTSGGDSGYLVVWQQENIYTGTWYIRGSSYDQNGTAYGVPGFTLHNPAGSQTYPVAIDGWDYGSYLLFRQATFTSGEEIWANYCQQDPNTVELHCGDPRAIEEAAFWNAASPDVAASFVGSGSENLHPSYLIVYEGDSGGDPTIHRRIYGRLLAPEQVFLPSVAR